MQTIQAGYKAFGLLMTMNWDRLICLFTLAVALAVGGWVGSL